MTEGIKKSRWGQIVLGADSANIVRGGNADERAEDTLAQCAGLDAGSHHAIMREETRGEKQPIGWCTYPGRLQTQGICL